MKILCSICAQGNSKGLRTKTPNFLMVLDMAFVNQARKSKIFSKIICSSNSNKILKIAKN